MDEENRKVLARTALQLRGKFSDKEISQTVSREGVYDIQGVTVDNNPIDIVGFTSSNLQIDCAWVPFNFSKPDLGRYQIGANRKGNHVSILGEIPFQGTREIQRLFVYRLISGLYEEVEKGAPDLELPNIVKEKIQHYPEFLTDISSIKPDFSLN